MTTANTNAPVLKEGENKVEIVGVLVEKNLEPTSYKNDKGETIEGIKGSISVRTSESEVHQIQLQSNKLTKAGAENKMFLGYQTIQNEYVTVADAANNPELKPDMIRVNGSLNTNEYYGQDGQLKQYQQVKGKFVNRLTDKDDPTPRATFEVEVFVDAVRPEIKNDEETGRVKLSAWIPTYNSIVPYNFSVVAEGADFFTDTVEKASTIKVYGQLLNVREEHIKLVEAGFGADIEEKTYTYINEALVKTAAMPYEEESAKTFKPELVKEALAKREVYLEKSKARVGQGGQQQSAPPTGFGGNTEVKKPAVSGLTGVDVSALF